MGMPGDFVKIKKGIWPIIAFLISMGITFFSVLTIMNIQRENAIDFNDVAAERQSRLLQAMIDYDIDAIGSVANFFHATEKSDWHEFPHFAEGIVEGSHSIIAIQWMEKVSSSDARKHIQKVKERFPDAELYTTKDKHVSYGGVFNSDEPLYVASDIYPITSANKKVIGFYPTKERFRRVLKSITFRKKPNLSDKLVLLQDNLYSEGESDGFLVYYPVFDWERKALKGVVIGVLRASVYFEEVVSQSVSKQSVAMKIVDTGFKANDNDPVLYQSDDWDAEAAVELSKYLYFPNRTWLVHFRYRNHMTDEDKLSLVIITSAGIIISILITVIIYRSIRQQGQLERELSKRTRELDYMVNHDPQTGALNRRAFNYYCDERVNRADIFSLVVFDIDWFKSVNDEYGHPIGDKSLTHVTKVISNILETGDQLFRIGGDEFCILSGCENSVELEKYLDKIRMTVELNPLNDKEIINITISIGGAIWRGEDIEVLMHKADSALYKSKAKGRNAATVSAS